MCLQVQIATGPQVESLGTILPMFETASLFQKCFGGMGVAHCEEALMQ